MSEKEEVKKVKQGENDKLRCILSEFYDKLYDIYFQFKDGTKTEVETFDLQNVLYKKTISEIQSLIQSAVSAERKRVGKEIIEEIKNILKLQFLSTRKFERQFAYCEGRMTMNKEAIEKVKQITGVK